MGSTPVGQQGSLTLPQVQRPDLQLPKVPVYDVLVHAVPSARQ